MLTETFDKLSTKFHRDNLKNLSDQELIYGQKDIINAVGYYRTLELTAKVSANSLYGAFGTNSNRYFLQALAEDICSEGRYYIKLMDKLQNDYFKGAWLEDTEFLEELRKQPFGHIIPEHVKKPKLIDKDYIVYIDTDSTYARGDLILKSLDIEYRKHSNRTIVEFLQYIYQTKMKSIFNNALETTISKRHGHNIMDFELEVIGGKGIFIEKKKYIFTVLSADGEYVGHKGWFKNIGIEIQQSGSSKLVHSVLKAFINAIFTKWDTLDERTFFSMCNSVKKQLSEVPINDLAKINGIKTYDKYVICDRERVEHTGGPSANVKGAMRYNHLIYTNNLQNKYPYIKQGMRCKWYYDANGDAFSYPDDVWPYEIAPEMDRDTQLDKLIFDPVKRYISGLFKADLKQMSKKDVQYSFNMLMKHKK